MSLDDWKHNAQVNLAPLERSARCVAVVVPTCPLPAGTPGERRAALFTTRGDRATLSAQLGLPVHPLSRAALFAELTPSVVQRLVAPNAAALRPYGWFQVEAPSAAPVNALGGEPPPLRIAPTGYLMTRASAASDQKAFKGHAAAAASATDDWVGQESSLVADPARVSAARIARARSILERLDRCLDVWARFAGRGERLTYSFLLLLQRCAALPLPPFSPGELPPPGLLRAVQRLLLDESSSAQLDLEAVEWAEASSLWAEVGRQKRLQDNLKAVAAALRDHLRGLAPQHDTRAVGGMPLSELAAWVVGNHPELGRGFVEEYRDAVTALQEIRELLRLKSIQGNVLLGVLESFQRLEAVKDLAGSLNENKRNLAIEQEILRPDSAELRPPRQRPTPDARRAYTEALLREMHGVVAAVADGDEGALAALPAPLQALARQLRGEPRLADALRRVAGGGAMERSRFSKMLGTLVEGLLCPALFGSPELELLELVTLVGGWLGDAYLLAIQLTPESALALRAIGERHEEAFRHHVADGAIRASVVEVDAHIVRDVLTGVVATEANARLADRAHAALNTAITGHTLAALAPGWRPSPLPIFPSDAGPVAEVVRGSAANLAPRPAEVQAIATSVAKQLTDRAAAARPDPMRVPAAVRRVLLQVLADGTTEEVEDDRPDPQAEIGAPRGPRGTVAASGEGGAEHPRGPAPGADRDCPGADRDRPGAGRGAADAGSDDPDAFGLVLAEAARRGGDRPDHMAVELAADERFRGAVAEAELAWSEFLHTVLHRYADGHAPDRYRRDVKRLMLAELMLDLKEELNLGKEGSFLYRLLLDLVADHDPAAVEGDFRPFLRRHSLTEYIDVMRAGPGRFFGPIMKTVEQGEMAFRNLSGYLSDVAGLAYTFDQLAKVHDATVLVFNGTAQDWADWVRDDTFSTEPQAGRFYPGRLVGDPERTLGYGAPAAVFFTDSAFPATGDDKLAWLQATFGPQGYRDRFCRGNRWAVHPPVLLGEGRDGEHRLPAAAALTPSATPLAVPVHWLGPPPPLNRRSDGMATVLPAGFLLAVRLLGGSVAGLVNPGLERRSEHRLHVLGAGAAPLDTSLANVLWSDGALDAGGTLVEHPLVADAYLHLLLVLEAAARAYRDDRSATNPDRRPEGIYRYALRDNAAFNDQFFQQSWALSRALLGGTALRVSLDGNPALGGLGSVRVALDETSTVMSEGGAVARATDVSWLVTLRGLLGFPVFQANARAA